MRAALHSLLERHELLNVNYRLHQGEPCACPHAGDLAFEILGAEGGGKATSSEWLHAEITRIAGSPIDLEHDPLISFTLLQVGEQEHIWIIRMHHIVADGWSKGILLRDFTRLYGAELDRQHQTCSRLRSSTGTMYGGLRAGVKIRRMHGTWHSGWISWKVRLLCWTYPPILNGQALCRAWEGWSRFG